MNRGHKMLLKRNRAESLGCHGRHPLPRVCLREPGSRDVINWQWRYVIHAQMICYRNNRYLHYAPSVSLWKTVQHRQDYLSRWLTKFRTQYNTKTDPQTDDNGAYYDVYARMRLRTNFAAESRVVTWSCGDRSVSKETYCVAYNLTGVWRITF